MEVPEGYGNGSKKLPYKDWKQEWKDYKNWKRRQRMNPKWANLTDEQRKIERNKVIAKNREIMLKKWHSKTPEEKAIINKKKSDSATNLTPEEKAAQSERNTNASNKFWQSMSQEERDAFVKRREEGLSEEHKKARNEWFAEGGRRYMASRTKDEIDIMIKRMNDAYRLKCETNDAFREEQVALLRKHNEEYWDGLTAEEKAEIRKKSFISSGRAHNNFHVKFEEYFANSILSKSYRYVPEQILTSSDGKVSHRWDYAIYDLSKNLVGVLDLDGAFFHGDLGDYNGLHCAEEYDEKRPLTVPEGVKVSIIYEEQFTKSFEKFIKTTMATYDEYLEFTFQMCRMMPFPCPQYDSLQLYKSWCQLLRLTAVGNKHTSFKLNNREGDRIISNFHESIYHARRDKCISPYEAWYDDDKLRRVIANRMVFQNDLNRNKILQGFNVSRIAPKVSVFSAGRAKLLIEKYLPNAKVVFDPFSGFSGRMLGTLSLDKHYIGRDISETHITESVAILKFLESKGVVINASMERHDIMSRSGEKFQTLFTCPPYGMKEQWQDVELINRSCDEWIYECLSRFECEQYLFVVDKTSLLSEFVVEKIPNRSHISNGDELVILISQFDRKHAMSLFSK